MIVARSHNRLRSNESTLAYIFVLPSLLFLAAFMFYPILNVVVISLFQTNKVGNLLRFVGVTNYVELIKNSVFDVVLLRSALWTAAAVAVKTGFGLIIASLLNTQFPGRKIARTLFLIPWASSAPISAILWRWVFHPQFGLLNYTLKATGVWPNPPVWLGGSTSAFVAVIWVDIWLGIPFMALVFLAGMQSVSLDLYEVADVEGASALQKFVFITIPGIRSVLLVATLLSTLWTFNDFNTIYVMTRGGPSGSTHILITYLYERTFQWLNWSSGSVMAVITFIILSVVAWVYAIGYFRRGE
jgi:multiple sugar transport system permease protein